MNNLGGLSGNNAGGGAGATGGATGGGHGGDMFDKGVNAGLNKSGHGQKPATVEKISDGIKSGVAKLTGKQVPGGDKEFQ